MNAWAMLVSNAVKPVPVARLAEQRPAEDLLSPHPWRFATRAIAARLFLTCWIVYSLHFATDVAREHYLALAIGEDFSFRVDEYGGLHPDLFETERYGWHIGNNPGGSMFAALPYAVVRPFIDTVVERVQQRRATAGLTEPPEFETPRGNARIFYAEAWRRGLDVKLGLAAFVMQVLAMAPFSALGVVLMFYLLRRIFRSDRRALWTSLLFAFGTPVFYRTGFLNHNLMLGFIAFAGFLVLWNPGGRDRRLTPPRLLLGGLAGGLTVLFDYSGVVFLGGLFAYALVRLYPIESWRDLARGGAWYMAGSLSPIGLLWLYQWRSFGNPFLPGQHWMPPVRWIEEGYQGYGGPQLELLGSLLWDYRYGLFASAPLLLLALACPLVDRGEQRRLPPIETWFLLGLAAALWVFFSGSNYTRLQFNTGMRYMAPSLPFLFVPAAVVLMRLRPLAIYLVAMASVVLAWCMAMNREVWDSLGVLDPVASVFTSGFQLPVLTTLSRMSGQFGDSVAGGVSPLPLFALTAAILFAIWSPRFARGHQRVESETTFFPLP